MKKINCQFMTTICGVSKKFGELYQKTNKTEDTNKLTLLAFKIIAILHNTLLATFIKLLETVSKGLFRNRSQNSCQTFLDCRRIGRVCTSGTTYCPFDPRFGCTCQVNILALLESDILSTFSAFWQWWRAFPNACAQSSGHFRKNVFACGNLSLL
jgi:hypothetical protein